MSEIHTVFSRNHLIFTTLHFQSARIEPAMRSDYFLLAASCGVSTRIGTFMITEIASSLFFIALHCSLANLLVLLDLPNIIEFPNFLDLCALPDLPDLNFPTSQTRLDLLDLTVFLNLINLSTLLDLLNLPKFLDLLDNAHMQTFQTSCLLF